MILSSCVFAGDFWFTWKHNPTNEFVTSYVIEQSKSPNTNFVAVVTISGTTNVGVIKGLTAGTYKFRLVAKNGVGTSKPSSELSYPTNAPSAPLEFNYTVPR
jgi:hypothetical protein